LKVERDVRAETVGGGWRLTFDLRPSTTSR